MWSHPANEHLFTRVDIGTIVSFNDFQAPFSTILVSHFFLLFFYNWVCSVVASAIHKQLVITKHKAAAVGKKERPAVVVL